MSEQNQKDGKMAFPIGALIGGVSSSAGSSDGNPSGESPYATSTISKIIGPLSPTFWVNSQYNKKAKQKAEDEANRNKGIQDQLVREQLASSVADRQAQERSQNMSGIQMLANQRAQAMQMFGNQKLKKAYFRS